MVLLPGSTPNPHRRAIPDEAAFSPAPVIAAKGHPMREAANIGIRVFQVSRLGEQVTETRALSADDVLAFTYTFAEERPGYLALFGIQEGGEVLWYYPECGQPRSIPIKGGVVDEPLQEGIDLAVNHRPGWLRITALFSDEPIEVDAVEEAVETLRRRGDELNPSNPFPEAEYATLKGQYSVKVKIKGKR
jgi:hypothetical protein